MTFSKLIIISNNILKLVKNLNIPKVVLINSNCAYPQIQNNLIQKRLSKWNPKKVILVMRVQSEWD